MDVAPVKFSLEETSFIIREEVIASIEVRASSMRQLREKVEPGWLD